MLSHDFVLQRYLERRGMTWADLTGHYPQKKWRTYLDMWYDKIRNEASSLQNQSSPTPEGGQSANRSLWANKIEQEKRKENRRTHA